MTASGGRDFGTIGLVGAGRMGIGIATNLQAAGHEVVYLEHEGNQDVSGITAAGARGFASGEELAGASRIIILCVTGSPQVEEAMTRRNGILAGLQPGSVVIDCSTAIPGSTREMARRVGEAGGEFMDAAMTRTPREAMAGRLNLLVGADGDLLERMRPLLECFAENIVHAGGVSSGHALKLIHNFVSLGSLALIAEAAAAADRAGISLPMLVDVLEKGGGGGIALERMKPVLLQGETGPLQFTIANSHKDVGYYCAMSEALNAERHVAEGVFTLLNEALGHGHGQHMIPQIARILAGREPEDT